MHVRLFLPEKIVQPCNRSLLRVFNVMRNMCERVNFLFSLEVIKERLYSPFINQSLLLTKLNNERYALPNNVNQKYFVQL